MALRFKIKNCDGIVLISSLVLLLIISLLVFSSVMITQLSQKVLQNEESGQRTFYIAEDGLKQIERDLKEGKFFSCVYQAQTHDFFLRQSIEWLGSFTVCQLIFEEVRMNYVIEDLLKSGCLNVSDTSGKVYRGGQYWRITLIVKDQFYPQVALQSTIVLPLKNPPHCLQSRKEILQIGRQSWQQMETFR